MYRRVDLLGNRCGSLSRVSEYMWQCRVPIKDAYALWRRGIVTESRRGSYTQHRRPSLEPFDAQGLYCEGRVSFFVTGEVLERDRPFDIQHGDGLMDDRHTR